MTPGRALATIGRLMPIVRCPGCGVRQYAAATYASLAACVECQTPLPTTRATGRPRFLPFDRRIERTAAERRTAS
jgi:hypothetical protein